MCNHAQGVSNNQTMGKLSLTSLLRGAVKGKTKKSVVWQQSFIQKALSQKQKVGRG